LALEVFKYLFAVLDLQVLLLSAEVEVASFLFCDAKIFHVINFTLFSRFPWCVIGAIVILLINFDKYIKSGYLKLSMSLVSLWDMKQWGGRKPVCWSGLQGHSRQLMGSAV
jgi:hypothetical protein